MIELCIFINNIKLRPLGPHESATGPVFVVITWMISAQNNYMLLYFDRHLEVYLDLLNMILNLLY